VLVHLGVPPALVPAQLLQAAAHASSSGRVRLASYSVWRLTTRSVAAQTSAQSRSRRMDFLVYQLVGTSAAAGKSQVDLRRSLERQ